MARDVSIKFSLKDNFSDGIKSMIDQQSKFKKDLASLNTDLTQLNNKKIDLKIDAKKAQDDLRNTKKDAAALGISFDDLYRERANKELAIRNELKLTSTQIKQTEKDINNLTSEVSKFDNNISSRNNKSINNSSGTLFQAGIGAMLGNQLSSFVTDITGNFLSNSLNSGLSGLITGGMTGSAFGPIGTVVGATVGGISSYIGAEVQKQTDKQKQRIQFGSGLLQQYIPDLALSSINYSSDMEQTRIGYETMLGKEGSDKFLSGLLDFAAKTPFEFNQLTGSGKKMLAYGFNADEIVPTLTAIGDAASGLGLGTEGIDAITTALGRMKVSSKVTLEYINPLLERGVDVWGILSEATGKTTAQLQDMVSKGTLPAQESILALINGMENRFPNMMEKQAKSYDGLISTISDGMSMIIKGPLGDGFLEGIKPSLERFAEFFDLGTEGFSDLKDDIFNFGKEAGTFLGNAIDSFRVSLSEFLNDEDFKNASLPDKFKMVLDELLNKANEWYDTGGQDLINSINGFFTDIFVKLAENDEFLQAAQNLWLTISPDEETMKKIIKKAIGWGGFENSSYYENMQERQNYYKSSRAVNRAMGIDRVPYDNYPIMAHEGEKLLTRVEADNYSRPSTFIAKLADMFIIREEADIPKIAAALVDEIESREPIYGGANG